MAYINAEQVKKFRTQIKKAFPKWNISVRKDHNSSLTVTILSADIDFIGQCKYDGNHGGYIQVNTYYLDRAYEGDALAALEKISEIANAGNHDNSDSQRDHFDVGWYFNLHIGAWDKPFTKI